MKVMVDGLEHGGGATMSIQMLEATQRAADAAQSASLAAWWAVVVNGLVVLAAIGITLFQESRVTRRAAAQQKAFHDGAIDTLRRGRIALERGKSAFDPAGTLNIERINSMAGKLNRARRLIAVYSAREVEPPTLMLLLIMDDVLEDAQAVGVSALNQPAKREGAGAAFIADFDRFLVIADGILKQVP